MLKIRTIQSVAWYLLLIIGIFVFAFSMFSGSEAVGVMESLPNTIPWIVLLLVVLLARRSPVIGGLLTMVYGLFLLFYLNLSGPDFNASTFILTLVIPLLGLVILLCGYRIQDARRGYDKTR